MRSRSSISLAVRSLNAVRKSATLARKATTMAATSVASPRPAAVTNPAATVASTAPPATLRTASSFAGQLGRRTLCGLRSAGCEPLAFVDNQPRLRQTRIDGLPVLPPQEAAARYGSSAVFVVTIFNHAAVRRQLAEMNCASVVSFPSLFWKYAGTFLPYGGLGDLEEVCSQREAISAALDLWDDERSRDHYLSQLRWRMTLDSEKLPRPCSQQETYFPEDLVHPSGRRGVRRLRGVQRRFPAGVHRPAGRPVWPDRGHGTRSAEFRG